MMPARGGVLHLEPACTLYLDAIVEVSSVSKSIGSKAGAGIVDLEELNRSPGPVFDCSLHVMGTASGREHQSRQQYSSPDSNEILASSCHSLFRFWAGAASSLGCAATCFSSRSRRLSNSGRR